MIWSVVKGIRVMRRGQLTTGIARLDQNSAGGLVVGMARRKHKPATPKVIEGIQCIVMRDADSPRDADGGQRSSCADTGRLQ